MSKWAGSCGCKCKQTRTHASVFVRRQLHAHVCCPSQRCRLTQTVQALHIALCMPSLHWCSLCCRSIELVKASDAYSIIDIPGSPVVGLFIPRSTLDLEGLLPVVTGQRVKPSACRLTIRLVSAATCR